MKPVILFLFSLSVAITGCYTMLDTKKNSDSPPSERERELKEFLSWGIANDYDLLGEWENSKMWMDYGERIKRVKFNSDGTVYYCSSAEIPDCHYARGKYRVRDDTLWIYYDDHNLLEKYHYKIDQNRLSFSTINENKNEPYSITDNNASVWNKLEHQ